MAATPATSLTLVTSGLQDARLQPSIGNPDLKQFVHVLRRTTRWAALWYRIDFDGQADFGQRVTMTLPRKGELVTGLTIVAKMPDIFTIQKAVKDANPNFLGPTYSWTNSLGHALIQFIELEIGGVIVDSLDSVQLELLDELYETVEASVSKNTMISRIPNNFGQTSIQGDSTNPVTIYTPIPFWWSRPGAYAQALPIDALNQDRVRIHVTFRPVNQLFYTDARVDPRTVGFRPGTDISGAMWGIEGGRFWRANVASTTRVYAMNSTMTPAQTYGEIIPNFKFPNKLHLQDTYALVEYISLEEAEAIAFRSAELTYRVPQHIQVPVVNTNNNTLIRIPLPYANPVKEIYWVAQRPEVSLYNSWFLFTRDLQSSTVLNPTITDITNVDSQILTNIPWWPDCEPIPKPENNWMVQPAFREAYSEPIIGATITYNSIERIAQNTGSTFRALVPALQFTKSAIYNRYVYAYSFSQKQEAYMWDVKGFANWDKIPRKELYITLNNGWCGTTPPNLNIYTYLTIWNVFKVFGGRGAMLFTN